MLNFIYTTIAENLSEIDLSGSDWKLWEKKAMELQTALSNFHRPANFLLPPAKRESNSLRIPISAKDLELIEVGIRKMIENESTLALGPFLILAVSKNYSDWPNLLPIIQELLDKLDSCSSLNQREHVIIVVEQILACQRKFKEEWIGSFDCNWNGAQRYGTRDVHVERIIEILLSLKAVVSDSFLISLLNTIGMLIVVGGFCGNFKDHIVATLCIFPTGGNVHVQILVVQILNLLKAPTAARIHTILEMACSEEFVFPLHLAGIQFLALSKDDEESAASMLSKFLKSNSDNGGNLLLALQSNSRLLSISIGFVLTTPKWDDAILFFLSHALNENSVVEAILSCDLLDFLLERVLKHEGSAVIHLLKKTVRFSPSLADHFSTALHGFEKLAEREVLECFWAIDKTGDEKIVHRSIFTPIFSKSVTQSFREKAISKIVGITTIRSIWNLNICKEGGLVALLLEDIDGYAERQPILWDFLSLLLRFSCQFEDSKMLIRSLKRDKTLHDKLLIALTSAIANDTFWPTCFYAFRWNQNARFSLDSFQKSLNNSEFSFFGSFYFTEDCEFCIFNMVSLESEDFFRLSIVEGSFIAESAEDKMILAKNQVKSHEWQNIALVYSTSIFAENNMYMLYCNGKLIFNGKIESKLMTKGGSFQLSTGFAFEASDCYVDSIALFLYPITIETINSLSNTKVASQNLKTIQLLPQHQQPIVYATAKSNANISSCHGSPKLTHNLPIISRIPVRVSLQAMGGIEILFPLLTQIEEDQSSPAIDQQKRLILVSRLFLALLGNSNYHLKNFLNSKGPRLFSLFLQKTNYLSIELLEIFLEMKQFDPILANTIDSHILFEPQIWSRTNKEIQESYIKMILNDSSLLSTRTLTSWMDAVELYFPNCPFAWKFLEILILKSESNKREEARMAESLFCCTNSEHSDFLVNTFSAQLYKVPHFYFSVLEAASSSIVLSLLKSDKEPSRLFGFDILQNAEYFTNNDSSSKTILSLKDIPSSSLVEILNSQPQSFAVYLKILSLCFQDFFKQASYRESIKIIKFKSLKWLSILLNTIFVFSDSNLKKTAVYDLVFCMLSSSDNASLVGKSLNLETLMTDFKHSSDPDYLKRILYIISTYVFSNPANSPRLLREAVVEILLFGKGATTKVSLLFEVVIGRIATVERLPVLEIFEVIDEVFFYHKDMSLALYDEFDGANLREVAENGVEKKRRSSTSPALLYQKCYPFEEFPVSMAYANSLQKLLAAAGAKTGFFGNTYREKCEQLFVRLLISSLSVFDASIWSKTLNLLGTMVNFQDHGKYLLGALYEAYNLDSTGRLLVLPNILTSLEACSKSLVDDKLALRSTLDSACSNLSSLSAFLESPEFKSIYDSALYPITRKVENDWISKVASITKRMLGEVHSVLSIRTKRLVDEKSANTVVFTLLDKQTKIFQQERYRRFALQSTEYEKEKQEISKIWVRFQQEVTFERRVWTDNSGNGPNYYKVFPAETSSRLRLRHLRNLDSQSHLEASSKRDKLPLPTILLPTLPSPLGLPDRKKILNNKLHAVQLDSSSDSTTEESSYTSSLLYYASQTEVCIVSIECELVYLMISVPGKVEITNKFLRFYPAEFSSTNNLETPNTIYLQDLRTFSDHKRPISSLSKVFLRKYKMRQSALEAFFIEGDTFLFNFSGTSKEANAKRHNVLRVLQGLQHLFSLSVTESVFSKTNYTQLWIDGNVSNFQYLMILNTYSGRTFNDLSQYPVFPLILVDYASPFLDLDDPSIYRDLSKSIGSLNESRLKGFLERYEALKEDISQFPFMYGTHYCSSSSVLFYLLRVEPFTSLHIQLQNGKFDHADRQFHSLKSLYESVTTNSGDVKELIPEFFYFPDFLRNLNGFDLGKCQSGERVDDVVLPPWAKSPEDFIRIHREALESFHVSQHLHLWIDLIWGSKQRGEEAIRANNLFHYLTYDGAVDVDEIEDEFERKSIEDQMNYFGQTPLQLFEKPHPPRSSLPIRKSGKESNIVSITLIEDMGADRDFTVFVAKSNSTNPDFLVVGQNLVARMYKCDSFRDANFIKSYSEILKKDDNPFFTPISSAQGLSVTPNLATLFIPEQFDDSIHSYHIEGESLLRFSDRIYDHLSSVSCSAVSECGKYLVTGGNDFTVRLWSLQANGLYSTVIRGPRKTYFGHDALIQNLEISSDLGIAVSCSGDRSIMIHSLFHSLGPISISLVDEVDDIQTISLSTFNGDIYAFGSPKGGAKDATRVNVFNINGRRIFSSHLPYHVNLSVVSQDEKFLFISSASKLIVLSTSDFSLIASHLYEDHITSIAEYPSAKEQNTYYLLVATRNSHLHLLKFLK